MTQASRAHAPCHLGGLGLTDRPIRPRDPFRLHPGAPRAGCRGEVLRALSRRLDSRQRADVGWLSMRSNRAVMCFARLRVFDAPLVRRANYPRRQHDEDERHTECRGGKKQVFDVKALGAATPACSQSDVSPSVAPLLCGSDHRLQSLRLLNPKLANCRARPEPRGKFAGKPINVSSSGKRSDYPAPDLLSTSAATGVGAGGRARNRSGSVIVSSSWTLSFHTRTT